MFLWRIWRDFDLVGVRGASRQLVPWDDSLLIGYLMDPVRVQRVLSW